MSADLLDELRAAYPADRVHRPSPDEVWSRGRRSRRRRQASQVAAAALTAVVVAAGVRQVAAPAGLTVVGEPAAPVAADGGWDVLAPGTFTYEQVDARLSGWEPVLALGETPTVAFDVADDGTVAAFVPATGELLVRPSAGDLRRIDASFLLGAFPADRTIWHLRVGPDRRLYLTSHDPEAERDPHRLTVFSPTGELVGSTVTPVSHQPPVFAGQEVLLRTDERGWAGVATVGGPLRVDGRVGTPDVPSVTWIDDQGPILHQLMGGPMLGERYRLEADGQQRSWTGPTDGVVGWAGGALREDQPAVVIVQHEEGPPLVLAPALDGLRAAWADPDATGLAGVGDHRAILGPGADGPVLYWLQEVAGGLAVVRATPS